MIKISPIRAGRGECIHIHYIGDTGKPHNIIVDTGPASSAAEFRMLTQSILNQGEDLDILFVTHYDEDHIGGILKVGDPGFKNIYFNAYTGAEECENLSAIHAQRLFNTLPSGIVHPAVLAGEIIKLDGAKISILAPTKENLSGAMDKMHEVQLSGVSDWRFSFDMLMEKEYPSPDTSVSNKASIVFAFEYDGYRALFCGDAPADAIMEGLGCRQRFDLVKLPHHGSCRNISNGLLDKIDADTFMICADGTSHPNKQTLAKLIKHYGTITICSSYSWWTSGLLAREDYKYIKKIRFTGNLE